MRFRLNIQFLKLPVKVRKDYRRDILKFIKKILYLENQEIYQKYYTDKKVNKSKPFTFSVSFEVHSEEKDYFILKNNIAKIHFSFIDPIWGINIYNGILKLKNNPQIFTDSNEIIRNIYLERAKKIDDKSILFKTFSPILVRKFEGKKGVGFLSFDDPNFKPNLISSILSMAKRHLLTVEPACTSHTYRFLEEEIDIDIIKMRSNIINNYGGEIGNKGIIKISAPTEILKLIYDGGIGAKRSQGFGMLEVIG